MKKKILYTILSAMGGILLFLGKPALLEAQPFNGPLNNPSQFQYSGGTNSGDSVIWALIKVLEALSAGSKSIPPSSPNTNVHPTFEAPPSLFRNQFGIGVTAFPAQYLWQIKSGLGHYQAGFQLDLSFRHNQRLTFELGLGFTGYQEHQEFISNLGLRIHIHRLPKDPQKFHLAPYFVLGGNFALGSPPQGSTPTNVYLGGQAGIGLELRFGDQATLHFDVRGLFRGNIEAQTPFALQAGLRTGVGFGFYF